MPYPLRTLVLAVTALQLFILCPRALAAGPVMGNIDGVRQDSVGNMSVYGWACNSQSPDPIFIDLYVNAPYPSGVMLGRFLANQASEPGVAQACASTGSAYRFSIQLQSQWRSQYGGSNIYIYGISPNGGWNLLLNSSGNYKITPLPMGAGQTFSPWQHEPYVIGAWYFGMWSRLNSFQANQSQKHLNRFDPWGGIRDWYLNPSQAPSDYGTLKPQIGYYDQLDQRVMDTHIQQAASRGLTYFAFYWYWDVDRNEEYYANSVAVHRFLSSSHKSKMKFMISAIAIRSTPSGTVSWDTWKNRLVPYLVNTFITDPSYLTTSDGRPIIMDWDFGLPPSLHKQGLTYLRDYVIAKTGKNPFILAYSDDLKSLSEASAAMSNGLDGFQSFTFNSLAQSWPESYDISVGRWKNQIFNGTGYFQLLGTVAGWDPRAWNLVTDGPLYSTYNNNMNPSAFANHLNQIRGYLDQNPATTAKMLTIYAWNEWGEGGVIEPDVRRGTSYIDTIQGVFGLASRSTSPAIQNLEATYPAAGVKTDPFNTLIQDAYKTFLGRAASSSEVTSWSSSIQNGLVAKSDFISSILASTEYAATWKTQLSTAAGRINLTYNQLLGRNPTADELTYWAPYAMTSLSTMQTSLLFSRAHEAYDPVLYPSYGVSPQVGTKTTDMYRLRNGADYLYTNNFDEVISAQMNYGYTFESRPFSILQSPQAGATLPLMRCRINSSVTHFMSTSPTCEGQVVEMTLGHVYINGVAGTTGLARYRGLNSYIYLQTTNSNEISLVLQKGYIYEGITGYVLP